MLYNSKRKKLCRHLLAGGAACLMGIAMFSCTDKYDLDEEQPSGYNTIYTYLQERGNFSTYLRLIDDLGQREYLSLTGSITLFIANDETFSNFFKSNDWGVSSYDELSLSQKRLLLNTAMIGNVYPVSMLSTASAGNTSLKGRAVRQYTTLGLTDSVEIVKVTATPIASDDPSNPSYEYSSDGLPTNSHWDIIRANREELPLFKDASGTPTLLVLTPQYFDTNRLLYTDMDFILGKPEGTIQAELSRNEPAAYINGARIVASQFCKNGYVHEVDKVITPLDNLAETLRKSPKAKAYSALIERFAAPYYSRTATDDYNLTYGTNYDSIFVKRYFSERSEGPTASQSSPFVEDAYMQGMEGSAQLSFDPGWTRYFSDGIHRADDGLKENMAVMIVPTDEAMLKWWNGEGGTDIRTEFGSKPGTLTTAEELIEDMAKTPSSTLSALINVNMQPQLTGTVPSRFGSILDDAMEVLEQANGARLKDHIVDIQMASNGLIYYTDKVFAPSRYSSVLFPTEIRVNKLNIIDNAIRNDAYEAYLNSMVSTYCLLLPTNDAMHNYIDPVSYGKQKQQLFDFNLNPNQNTPASKLYADVYNVTLNSDGTVTKESGTPTRIGYDTSSAGNSGGLKNTQILYSLEEIMDNMIAIGEVYPGKQYYPTKGNNFIRLNGTYNTKGAQMYAYGSWQNDFYQQGFDTQVPVQEFHPKNNGYAYLVDEVPMTTNKSIADVLAAHPEFSEFYSIVRESGCTQTSVTAPNSGSFFSASQASNGGNGNLVAHSWNMRKDTNGNWVFNEMSYQLLNAYHYTVYAPTNDAMKEAYAAGLPTIEDLAKAHEDDLKLQDEGREPYLEDSIQNIMRDFVRYHIHSNSIYMDAGFNPGNYESTRTLLQLQDTTIVAEDGTEIHTYKDNNGNGFYDCLSGRPYTIRVNAVSPTSISITDNMGREQTISSSRADKLFNLQAREMWLGTCDNNGVIAGIASVDDAIIIANSSSAVVHAIDKPLFYNYDASWKTTDPEKYKTDQFHYIKREIVNNEE